MMLKILMMLMIIVAPSVKFCFSMLMMMPSRLLQACPRSTLSSLWIERGVFAKANSDKIVLATTATE